jgi:hypothetical protein
VRRQRDNKKLCCKGNPLKTSNLVSENETKFVHYADRTIAGSSPKGGFIISGVKHSHSAATQVTLVTAAVMFHYPVSLSYGLKLKLTLRDWFTVFNYCIQKILLEGHIAVPLPIIS